MSGTYDLQTSAWLLPPSILETMRQIHGHLYDDEADLLLAAASWAMTLPRAPGTIVEIGSFQGKSTVGLGLAAKVIRPDAKVYAIDPHEGQLSVGDDTVNVAPTYDAFVRNVEAAGLGDTVIPIREFSTAVTWDKPISLLFIDGLHDYRSVSQDFAHFAPWVVSGGYIAFHDYGKPDFPGVTQFVDEIVNLGHGALIQRASGLVVLLKPDSETNSLTSPGPSAHVTFEDGRESQRGTVTLAYVILAHTLPSQLIRLVDRLDAPSVSFLIHVDRNADDANYREIVEGLRGHPNVYFLDRVACSWGTWSLVEATLHGLDRIVRAGLTPHHVVLLSGQDYPLKSPEAIEAFFAQNQGVSFIHYRAMPDDAWFGDGGMHRFRGKPLPPEMEPFRGSQWWALSGDCAAYVKGIADADRELIRFFEDTYIPDEMFFQTVLMGSPFRDRLMCWDRPGQSSREPTTVGVENLHFVDWIHGVPKVLSVDDFPRLIASDGLFARKFDMTQDAAILDMIDAHVGIVPIPAESTEPTTTEDAPGGMIVSSPYDEHFYAKYRSGALTSARAVVPVVIDLLRPRSIVDLGCGTGEWLAACREQGIDDVLGIDGDWVPIDHLQIPSDRFMIHDLCQPLEVDRTFDLAMSLETAEHLPAECAALYVAALVDLAPVVLISAAIPQQGGRNHLNEQWPRYWAALFHDHGYVAIDCVRPLIWTMSDVEWWYAQNTMVFAAASHVEGHADLKALFERHGGPPLPLVHPARYGGIDSWADELWRVRDEWRAYDAAKR